jgi:DNA-directed RNA polymerase subunit alpha
MQTTLLKPKIISVEAIGPNQAKVVMEPFERGYGHTLGNALRRVLLSSMAGYAPTEVSIGGVVHEYSTLDGVQEDVVNLLLNLKGIVFKLESRDEVTVMLRKEGPCVVTAADIDLPHDITLINPEHVIANLSAGGKLDMQIKIEKGRGYVPADEPRANELPFGHIAIDAIYTPIKNVKFSIENTRVEQKTDYEKLVLDIETDGSIHPEDALKGAAYILIQHFMLFSDQTMTFETPKAEEDNVVDEEMLHMRKLLKTSLADLDLSVRAYNCLKSADVRTLGELAKLEISDMMKFRNFGKKSLTELEQLIDEKGLTFGMDVAKYRLDED